MRKNWKKILRERDSGGPWKRMNISLSPQGVLALNSLAFDKLGKPEAVYLLFDEMNNCIGLQPTQPQSTGAFRVSPKHALHHVYILRLLELYKIRLPATVRFYDVEIDEDGILSLDLRTARVPPHVSNHVQNKRKNAPESPDDNDGETS
jgi:hypothetical protein